ncbi:hypothetical protein B0T18DRAFT_492687 [Schizothecium vesticola]|uniref:Uncharacterized protein n=1 Tax=Schizothecium vesticola TaxID=314040 RepID=A0AA40EIL8_9PEZI|nr:hypothetical protein B0T18DRAFT_492687 [Schizothecium vesticola]
MRNTRQTTATDGQDAQEIKQADKRAQENLRSLDSLLDRPVPELRHVMEKILGSFCWSFPQTLHRLQHYLHVIQRTPGPPPQAPPGSDSDSDSDEPWAKPAKTDRDDNSRAMRDAILKAPEDDLRALLKVFVMSDDKVLYSAWPILKDKCVLSGVPFTTEVIDARPKAASVEDANLCDKCDQAFLESQNGAEACVYHRRDWEVYLASGEWDDWVDSQRGEKEWAVNSNPRGFWYPCCGTTMDKKMPGCTTGRHWGRDDPRGPHAWMDEEEDWVQVDADLCVKWVFERGGIVEARGSHTRCPQGFKWPCSDQDRLLGAIGLVLGFALGHSRRMGGGSLEREPQSTNWNTVCPVEANHYQN